MIFSNDTAVFCTITKRVHHFARATSDWIVFASFWIAAAAAALSIAVERILALPIHLSLVVLIFCGTLSLYNFDRLLDLARDMHTAPYRSQFIRKNFALLSALAIGAGAISATLALHFGKNAVLLCSGIFALGLLHLRWKKNVYLKSAYLALAWLLVVVGLPIFVYIQDLSGPSSVFASFDAPALLSCSAWILVSLGLSLFANALATSWFDPIERLVRARNASSAMPRIGNATCAAYETPSLAAERVQKMLHSTPPPSLYGAKTITLFGVIVTSFAPLPLRWLMLIPLTTLLALLEFRPNERYPLFVLDGALLASATFIALFFHH